MKWQQESSFECPSLNVTNHSTIRGTGITSGNFDKPLPNYVKCIRFSRDGKEIAVGCADGTIRFFLIVDNTWKETNLIRVVNRIPITCVRWVYNEDSRVKDVLAATVGDGSIVFCHAPSSKLIWKHEIEDESLMCIDFSSNFKIFAAAGRRAEIRVFAEETKQEIMIMRCGADSPYPIHSGRIMSLRFVPQMPSRLISAGIDRQVVIWDVLKGLAVGHIPNVAPLRESVDVSPDGYRLLTASFRRQAPLQVWNTDTSEMKTEVPIDGKTFSFEKDVNALILNQKPNVNSSSLHTARWTPSCSLIVVGGSNINSARAFVREGGSSAFELPSLSPSRRAKAGPPVVHPVDSGLWKPVGYTEFDAFVEAVDVFEPVGSGTANPSLDPSWIQSLRAAVAVKDKVIIYNFLNEPADEIPSYDLETNNDSNSADFDFGNARRSSAVEEHLHYMNLIKSDNSPSRSLPVGLNVDDLSGSEGNNSDGLDSGTEDGGAFQSGFSQMKLMG